MKGVEEASIVCSEFRQRWTDKSVITSGNDESVCWKLTQILTKMSAKYISGFPFNSPFPGPAYNYLQLMFHEVFTNRTDETFCFQRQWELSRWKIAWNFSHGPPPSPSPPSPHPLGRQRDTVHPRKLVSYWLNITMNGLISIVPRHAPRYALGFLSIKPCIRTYVRAFAHVRAYQQLVYHSPFSIILLDLQKSSDLISDKHGNFLENVLNEAEQTRRKDKNRVKFKLSVAVVPDKKNVSFDAIPSTERRSWKMKI